MLDANDNKPVFDDDDIITASDSHHDRKLPEPCQRHVTISDLIRTDAFVVRIPASDLDTGDSLTYRILAEPATSNLFRVAASNGSVYWRPPQNEQNKDRVRNAILYSNEPDQALSFKVRDLNHLSIVS